MTGTHLAILIFGGIITAFAIVAVWAVKLYVQNKRTGIRHDETKSVDWDEEIQRTVKNIDEYTLPGGIEYEATRRND
jgi:hypothetical protein